MTYHKQFTSASLHYEPLQKEAICIECGKAIGAGTGAVTYDGHVGAGVRTVLFHPGCAAIVGQRLICDGYPNRRA